eukprot:3458193-Rhodomonas_salina.1
MSATDLGYAATSTEQDGGTKAMLMVPTPLCSYAMPYALPGTDLARGTLSSTTLLWHVRSWYRIPPAMPVLTCHHPTNFVLSCYAVLGTELAYGGMAGQLGKGLGEQREAPVFQSETRNDDVTAPALLFCDCTCSVSFRYFSRVSVHAWVQRARDVTARHANVRRALYTAALTCSLHYTRFYYRTRSRRCQYGARRLTR